MPSNMDKIKRKIQGIIGKLRASEGGKTIETIQATKAGKNFNKDMQREVKGLDEDSASELKDQMKSILKELDREEKAPRESITEIIEALEEAEEENKK